MAVHRLDGDSLLSSNNARLDARHLDLALPFSTLLMKGICTTMNKILVPSKTSYYPLAVISCIHGNDTIMHSLPPYNYANFFQEYPKICLIIAAFCTIVVSMYFWGLFRIRRKEQLDNTVLNGRFSSSVLNKVHQRITDKNADATKFSCGKESFKSETCNNFHDDEPNEVVAPFNELYGKLATAKLLAKAKKLENSMTEEERKELALKFVGAVNTAKAVGVNMRNDHATARKVWFA
ncbi:unnamed protein product [Onchocerca ochengi]|uniref:Uncharacterized protein n=1 Tax=Onchocerca ochengi TaxID=42157 RepID=A0A182DXZ3_ONCOC|nr:unnamed protein product [Onchocerca ochengi]